MGEFRMPSLGADMVEGTLLEWLVKPGQAVHRGDVVAVVDTAKSAVEVEVFEDGVVDRLLVDPGTTVAVGTPLAQLTSSVALASAEVAMPTREPSGRKTQEKGQAHVPSPLPRHRTAVAAKTPAPAAVSSTAPTGRARPATGLRASPLARRRAGELGVDLARLAGTGPAGAVRVADVEGAVRVADVDGACASSPASAPAPEGSTAVVAAPAAVPAARSPDERAAAMRQAIGELMARSKREIPHYYLTSTIDLSRATAWLHEQNARRDVQHRLVPAALLLKAAALACRMVPEMNGWWVDGGFRPSEQVHLGVAVALRPSGLVAPALLDADTLDVDTLMARLADLVARARAGTLRASELSAPTLTVTNLGDQGVEAVHGVIYPPQVALVGFGQVGERPWAVDGLLGVRTVVTATLAADHRVSDGHRGGRYLRVVADLLQRPEEL